MNSLSKLSFLVMALALGACNEKVSPELQGAATTSTTGGSSSGAATVPDEYYFRVVDTTDTMLNFKLHKSGAGNANTNCEISGNTALSSNAYRADPSTYDITCFYEAEELALRYNGFKFGIEASKNTCDYIGYGPFGYYDRIPGSSTQTLYEITCPESGPPNQAEIDSVVGATYDGIPCGQVRNFAVTPAGSFDPVETDADYCAFDYTDEEGPNCDTGVITINTTNVRLADTDLDGSIDDPVKDPTTTRTIRCGGKVASCLDGPYTAEGLTGTQGLKIANSTLNTPYSKEYTYAPLIGVYASNRKYVNFRRDLASLNIEWGNSNRNFGTADPLDDTDLSVPYQSSWSDATYRSEYNPELMAQYSDNKRMNGADLVTAAHQSFAAKNIIGLRPGFTQHVPYAAEPFLGFGSSKVNAFYTMYCFDNSYDVKARIRMVVRDWDRVHSTSATDDSFEKISDVYLLPPFARQDVPYTEEVSGEPDAWNQFNDVGDWDDFIDMEREDGGASYTPAITIWRTYPQTPYDTVDTNGFFNPLYFPAQKK